MARWEFKLPDIGEGVTEGEIVGWLVKPGDVVKEDQPMVEVMTDKATVTITAPKAGTVVETRGKVGEIVAVHSVLVVFELGAGAGASRPPPRGGGTNGHAKKRRRTRGHRRGRHQGAPAGDGRPAPARAAGRPGRRHARAGRGTSTRSPSRRPRRASSPAT